MPGVEATLARISQLQTRFTGVGPTTANRSAATTGTNRAGTATAFADALASASDTAAPSTALTPARRLPAGQYGTLQPPAELAAYGNGRIPADRLASIGPGHKLYAPAASAFTRMTAAAKRDGVTIGINDSYRDLAGQQRMAAQKGLYSQGGLAAEPGTSTHGWGVSTDLELDGRAQAWMRQHAADYGFVEDVAREPWHWTYRPAAG